MRLSCARAAIPAAASCAFGRTGTAPTASLPRFGRKFDKIDEKRPFGLVGELCLGENGPALYNASLTCGKPCAACISTERERFPTHDASRVARAERGD